MLLKQNSGKDLSGGFQSCCKYEVIKEVQSVQLSVNLTYFSQVCCLGTPKLHTVWPKTLFFNLQNVFKY